jgi:hypothetical protein
VSRNPKNTFSNSSEEKKFGMVFFVEGVLMEAKNGGDQC